MQRTATAVLKQNYATKEGSEIKSEEQQRISFGFHHVTQVPVSRKTAAVIHSEDSNDNKKGF